MKPITKELISEINSALDKGLVKGLGEQIEGEMCVEALICFKLGLPHSDSPPCVGSAVRLAKIALNDCHWSSNQARANGMRKLAIAQLGSDKINQVEFRVLLKLKSTQRILPYLIQKCYNELNKKDEKLLEYKQRFECLKKLDDALWNEFYNYYNSNYHNPNYHNSNYHNYFYYDYYDFYYNYNFYYYYNYISYYISYSNSDCVRCDDNFPLLVADVILQTLIELKSPGCKWLE